VQGSSEPARLRRAQDALAWGGDMSDWQETEFGHRLRHASPGSPEELAEIVRESELVITPNHSTSYWVHPTPAKAVFECDSLPAMIEAYCEHSANSVDYINSLERQLQHSRTLAESTSRLSITVLYLDGLHKAPFWNESDQILTYRPPDSNAATWIEEPDAQRSCIPHSDYFQSPPWVYTPCLNPVESILFDFPNVYESCYGSWRDWLVEAKVILANGELVKFGAKVVKNVSGFDLAKLLIGSRGTWCIPYEVTIRTSSTDACKKESNIVLNGSPDGRSANWIQRIKRTDLAEAVKVGGAAVIAHDSVNGTIWAETSEPLKRFEGDWLIRRDAFEQNLSIENPTQIALMKRTKQIFDPTNKLNPGEFGFI
jgi:hypothetical protein